MKPIPKSLHTVTVLVTMAKLMQQAHEERATISNHSAVFSCMQALGYSDSPDTYGLMEQAIKKLNKGK